jgi:hypothetical protein
MTVKLDIAARPQQSNKSDFFLSFFKAKSDKLLCKLRGRRRKREREKSLLKLSLHFTTTNCENIHLEAHAVLKQTRNRIGFIKNSWRVFQNEKKCKQEENRKRKIIVSISKEGGGKVLLLTSCVKEARENSCMLIPLSFNNYSICNLSHFRQLFVNNFFLAIVTNFHSRLSPGGWKKYA